MAVVADDAGTLLAIALLLLRMRARARSLSLNPFAESVCRCWKPRHLHAFRTAGLACACAMLLRPMRGCSCLLAIALLLRMRALARGLLLSLFAASVCRCWMPSHLHLSFRTAGLACVCHMLLRPMRGCSCLGTAARRCMRMPPCARPWLYARTLMQCHRLAYARSLSCLIRGCSCVCTTAGRTDMMRMRPQSCPELHASAPVEHLWLLEVAARTRRAVHLLRAFATAHCARDLRGAVLDSRTLPSAGTCDCGTHCARAVCEHERALGLLTATASADASGAVRRADHAQSPGERSCSRAAPDYSRILVRGIGWIKRTCSLAKQSSL